MPIYTYDCQKCGSVQEHITSYANRDNSRVCAGACGGALVRHGVELFTQGQPSFEGGAIMGDGRRVAGSWGKSARKKKGWYRP